jgi:transposase-like protein
MKRKNYPAELKFKVVMKLIKGEANAVELGQEIGCHPTLIGDWKEKFLKLAPTVFESTNKEDEKQRKIQEYEQIIGKLTIQNEFLKKVSGSLSCR